MNKFKRDRLENGYNSCVSKMNVKGIKYNFEIIMKIL